MTPYMFAKDGIAKHNGVSYTLEPIHFQGSPMEVTAVQSGDLDIAVFGSTSFAIAVENAGLNDIRIIADEVQDGVPGWAGPELRVLKDGPIKTIEDLRGWYRMMNYEGPANACFIVARNGNPQRRRVGLARWWRRPRETTVRLTWDRSGDSERELDLELSGGGVTGQVTHSVGYEQSWGVVDRRAAGGRTGPPQPSLCLAAAVAPIGE